MCTLVTQDMTFHHWVLVRSCITAHSPDKGTTDHAYPTLLSPCPVLGPPGRPAHILTYSPNWNLCTAYIANLPRRAISSLLTHLLKYHIVDVHVLFMYRSLTRYHFTLGIFQPVAKLHLYFSSVPADLDLDCRAKRLKAYSF